MYVPGGQERVVRGDRGAEREGVRGRKRYQGRRTNAVITWGDFLGPPTDRGPIPGQIRSLWENAKRSAHITQIPALLLVHTHVHTHARDSRIRARQRRSWLCCIPARLCRCVNTPLKWWRSQSSSSSFSSMLSRCDSVPFVAMFVRESRFSSRRTNTSSVES